MQVARGVAGHEAQRHAEGLAPRPARREPPGGVGAHPLLQLVLAAVERIADRGVPRELRAGNGVELEEAREQRARLVIRNGPGLGQRHCMGQVGRAQAVGKAGAGGRFVAVPGRHQRVGGAALQPPAASEIVIRHAAQTSGRA